MRLSSVLGVVNGRQLLIAVLGVKLPCNRKKSIRSFRLITSARWNAGVTAAVDSVWGKLRMKTGGQRDGSRGSAAFAHAQ